MGNWELEKIKEFIRGELKKGYDLDTIKTSLYRAGFPGSEISNALATFSRKPKAMPGFFSKLFAAKKEQKKPEPKEKPTPVKKGPSIFEKFFTKPQKTEAKPAPMKIEITKPEKPRVPSIFQQLFARKPRPVKIAPPKPHKKPFKIKMHIPKLKFPKINFPKLPKIPHAKGMTAVIFLIVFFAAIGVYMLVYPTACATENCFVRHANNCGKATYSNIIGGTTVLYEANNCVLRKTITAMSPEEPKTMVEAFLGKNMLCKYKEGDFSPLYLNTLSGLLTTCEGDLRTAIQKYVI